MARAGVWVTRKASSGLTDAELRASPVPVDVGATKHPISQQLVDTEIGLVTQTVIHGLTTGGGGGYRDVKVNPSGALTVDTGLTTQTDALTNTQLRESDVNVADSGEREYTHVVATVTAIGDTVIHTPAAGKRIRIRWIYAINDPTAATPTLIKVLLGGQEKYRVYALSKRQMVTGPIDGALTINLSALGAVAVTVLLEEV